MTSAQARFFRATTHSVTYRFLTAFVILSLLGNTFAPVVNAQSGAPIYLPIVANGAGVVTQTNLLFRTHVTVQTTVQWRDLERLAVVTLDKGDDWALLLVDDEQLETLARLRYNPDATNALETLATAHAEVRAAFSSLLSQLTTLRAQLVAAGQAITEATAAFAVRQTLRAAMHALSTNQLNTLAQAASVDSDSDGLTDDQESWWCTDPTKADSDSDGTKDGAEVTALRDWLNNKRNSPPSTGKPFQGWPPQKTNCFDDDQDSVPDLAESLDLGLNPNRESTDRDKFDDGQELFGQTYCTGQGGFCSYGPLPRNEDWGVIFAEMPSWVKAPGNHPLVAAFPVPEVDVVASSLKVETVTEVTTDHVIAEGTEKSYSTAKTEGASTSVSDTETWSDWQEVTLGESHPALQQLVQATSTEDSDTDLNLFKGEAELDATMQNGVAASGCLAAVGAACATMSNNVQIKTGDLKPTLDVTFFKEKFADYVGNVVNLKDSFSGWLSNVKILSDNNICISLNGCGNDIKTGGSEQQTIQVDQLATTQDKSASTAQSLFTVNVNPLNNSVERVVYQKAYPISYPIAAPQISRQETKGTSRGGSHTTSHTQYEEHTITNSEAFSNEESWGTATAVNSAHAADLTFTYKLRNTGTEYAREIRHLAFNIYIGDDPNPACTYFFGTNQCGVKSNDAVQFANFMPNEEKTFTSAPIPLSLDQMKAIDLGGPIRIVVEDFTYGIDELFYQDAANAGVLVAIEDGTDDGNETIDTYLIPTWGDEKVLDVLRRYFPHQTDANKNLVSISTPEYGTSKPTGCQEDYHVGTTWWCKHALSTADWWNVYTDGLGDGSEGFQDTPAVPGAVALFRFNKDTDLDGFSDRSEARLGTAINDATSFPKPEVLAGLHSIRSSNKVTATLSLLNTGLYDAYGVEAVMVAPDDSISITNNTVGGSGRVRALKQVIVGSHIALPALTNTPWSSQGHAVPAAGGYYVGSGDRTYTFVVNCPTTDCTVGEDTWTLNWSDGKGRTGSLPFGSSYKSPVFQAVDQGLTVALYTGTVKQNETFTVQANTPRDTFQYTINREPHTAPLVIVSYNDPQGNHRFVVPSQAMSLTTPTANLNLYAGQMLQDVGVELVTDEPFDASRSTQHVSLLVNNPSPQTVQNAHLFLEMINISGTVVAEIPTEVTLPPGPISTVVSFNTALFDPPYQPDEDYIVMAFLTDYQGNILDTAGRPLSSFQVDPQPNLVVNDAALTWNFGALPQGAIAKHPLTIANTGYGRLYTYFPTTAGITLNQVAAQTIGAADAPNYELTLRTAELPVGPVDRTITLSTSDPDQPTRQVHIQGTVTAVTADGTTGVLQRPLDLPVTVTGTHSSGEWVTFTHTLGPDAQKLHPVKVYREDYSTLYGVGKYATDFSQGTVSYEMFGDGRDGDLSISFGVTQYTDNVRTGIVSTAFAGQTLLPVFSAAGFVAGDKILIHQTTGHPPTGDDAGQWEIRTVLETNSSNLILAEALMNNYHDGGSWQAQVIRIPQYRNLQIQSGGTLTANGWDGDTGGILAFFCSAVCQVDGMIDMTDRGFRGGTLGVYGQNGDFGEQGESYIGGTQALCRAPNYGGGGGGKDRTGGGGGYGTAGDGEWGTSCDINNGPGQGSPGGTYGSPELSKTYLGSGGGVGISGGGGSAGKRGGNGGGLVFAYAKNLNVNGNITASGGAGYPHQSTPGRSGGGGSGGTIKLIVGKANIGSNKIMATGGQGGQGEEDRPTAKAGGVGRIRIEYCETVDGVATPLASTQKLDCYITEQVETAPYTTARLNLPTSVNDQATYTVQFGHKFDFAAAGDQLATVRMPAGLLSTATFDLLVTEVAAGDLTVKVDIGNDGSWEWEKTAAVTNAATFASDNLSAAFNAYWTSHGAPTTGMIELPLRVSASKAATVFITNLQQLNLTAAAGTPQLDTTPLDVTVALTGSHSAGEWVTFTHDLGPDPQHLQPVKVYSQDGATLLGVGKYATNFGQGTASADMFGDGRDGVMPGSGNLDNDSGFGAGNINGTQGSTSLSMTNRWSVQRIKPGDVVLIHQTRGSGAGQWELNKAASDFGSNTFTLQQPLKYTYVTNGGNERAQILRVPQYTTCNVTGTVTPPRDWNGDWGGIFAVMCRDGMTVSGMLHANGYGFRGGAGSHSDYNITGTSGESYLGIGVNCTSMDCRINHPNNGGGGGSGGILAVGSGMGAGGGYGIDGAKGGYGDQRPGIAYGVPTLSTIHLGSGGGGAFKNYGERVVGTSGANGGGIIAIYASSLNVSGYVQSNGNKAADGWDTGGGGSGGSIKIITRSTQFSSNLITAYGGAGGQNTTGWDGGNGGAGGVGRIHIEYCNTLTGTTNPAASTQKLDCYIAEQVETAPYTTVRLNLPESFSAGRAYTIQFGRKVDFAAAGEQVTALRVPAGLYSSAHLDALISGLPANASFALDVGNDGVVDWSSTVTNNSTNASPDLAAAFTAYWRSQGSPTAGTLDVPIKVTLDQPGQLLLTNLRVETTGSRVRYVRLPVQNYATFHLDFTLGETGVVAIDVGDNGSIDWSTPADTLRQETENLAAVINGYLNGKSGMVDMPLRFYLAPDAGVTLNDYRVTVNRTTDLIATQLHIGANTIQAAAVQTTTVPADTLVPVQATLRNGGNQDSGPVTAAFFAYAKGWGDWYIGSAYLENLAAGATTQISTTWDTTGFSGTLPVKVVINPYGRVPESNAANNTAQAPANVLPPSFPPIPDFTAAPRTGTAPLTVVFTSTVTPTVPAVTSWAWSFGDGGTSDQPQPVHTYTTAGLYTVTLTIVTAAGTETKTRAAYIAVNVPPPPVAAFSATPTSGAAPLTVQFMDQSAADVTAWAWDFGDGGVSSSRHPSHTYTAAGVYTVTLTVTSPGGSATKTQSSAITVGTPSITASLALTTGWNLVALPVQPVNPAIDQVLAPIAGKYTMVYTYNGCDPTDPWKKYDPAAPLFANDLTQLQATQGFWIKVSTPASLAVSGSTPVSVTQSLCAGWNLVSYPRQAAVAVGTALTPILACTEIVYAYVAADRLDYWKKYAPAAPPFANDLTELKPGLGYWLKAKDACTWPLD